MAVIRDPRHQRVLAREFDIRQGFVAPELEPAIQPVVQVADLESRDIYSDAPFLRRFAKSASGQGDATHPAQEWIQNPAGSNTLVIVRQLLVSAANFVAGTASAGFVTSPPAAQSTFRGAALNQRPSPGGLASAANVLAANNQGSVAFDNPGTIIFFRLSQTNSFLVTGLNIVLSPGGPSFMISQNENTATLDTSFFWDEIPLEP